jgi:hypothetical protein
MPGRISSSIGPIAVVAALVACEADVDLRTNRAYANDCLAAPNASAPQGQHWYYRIDRPNHRKCWYLHTTLPLLHRAVIKRAERHGSTPASVPMPESIEDSAPRSPHIRILAAKPQIAPFASTIAEEPSQQSAQEESDSSSIPQEPGARPLRSDPYTDKSDDPVDAAGSSEPTGRAGLAGALRLILLLLVPGLAIAGFLVPVVIKMVGERGLQIPETAWIDYRFFDERSDRRAQDERQDDRHRFGFADPRSRERFADQQDRVRESPHVPTRRSTTRSQETAATSVEPPRRDAQDIERALRVIKQARQHQTA